MESTCDGQPKRESKASRRRLLEQASGMKIIDNLNFQSNQSMRGGTREGAGRPKGSVGIKTKIRQQMIKAADDGELMPLDFMLQTLRDEEQDFAIRYKAAVDAAPICIPGLRQRRSQVQSMAA
jgi:hypothetical protein